MAIGAVFPVTIMTQYKGQLAQQMIGVERSVTRAGVAAEKSGAQFKSLAGAFTGLLIAGRIKDLFSAILKPTADLEMAFARLKGLTALSTAQLKAFRNEAMRVAGMAPYGPVEVTNALLQLQRASGSAKDSMRALAATTQMAMASFGEMSLEQTSKMMGEMMRTFMLSGKEADVAANMMFGAARTTGLAVTEYRDVMGKLGVAATRGGQSFGEMIKSFTLVRRAGITSRQAVTGLMRVMGELQKSKGIESFRQIGVDPIDAQTQALRPLSQIMLELTERFRKYPAAMKSAFDSAFRERSMKTALSMLVGLSKGVKDLEGNTIKAERALEMINGAMAQGGHLQKQSDLYLGTMSAAWTTLKEELTKVGIAIGEILGPALALAARGLKAILIVFNKIMGFKPAGFLIGVGLAAGTLRLGFLALAMTLNGMKQLWAVVIGNLRSAYAAQMQEKAATDAAAGAKTRLAAASRGAAAAVAAETTAHRANMIALTGSSALPAAIGPAARNAAKMKNFGMALSQLGTAEQMRRQGVYTQSWGGLNNPIQAQTQKIGRVTKALAGMKGAARAAGGAVMSFLGGPIGIIAGLTIAVIAYRKELTSFVDWANTKLSSTFDKIAAKLGGPKAGKGQRAYAFFRGMETAPIIGSIAQIFTMRTKIQQMEKRHQEEMARNADQKIYKKLVEGARKMKEALQLGGKALSDELDRLDKMMKWKPPEMDWRKFYALRKQLLSLSAQKGVPEHDKRGIVSMVAGMNKMEQITKESAKTGKPISPEDYRFMSHMGKDLYLASRLYQKKYKGTITEGTMKGFGKNFMQEMLRGGMGTTLEASRAFARFTGGNLASGTTAPGWMPQHAGYAEGGGGPTGGFIGNVMSGLFPTLGQSAEERAKKAQQQDIVGSLNKASSALAAVFSGANPLKVVLVGDETEKGGGGGGEGGGQGILEGYLGGVKLW